MNRLDQLRREEKQLVEQISQVLAELTRLRGNLARVQTDILRCTGRLDSSGLHNRR